MNTLRLALTLATLSTALAGCSSEPPHEVTSSDPSPPAHAAFAPVAGYQHVLSSSAFHLGTTQTQAHTGDFDRVVGSEGVFVTNPVNGAIFAHPTADSSAEKAAPLTTDVKVHNDAVRSYFTSLGLPADQVHHVDIGSSMTSSGRVGDRNPAPKFVGYTSTLVRRVAGFPVAESVAAARLNVNHEVVREHVYWPELPASVVVDAQALEALVHDPVAGPRFLSGLPEQGKAGRVVIHHTSAIETSPFVAMASFDVTVGRDVHHFDATGAEFRLSQESRSSDRSLETPR